MLAVDHDPVHTRAGQDARDIGAGDHLPHAHGLLARGKGGAETVRGLHDVGVVGCAGGGGVLLYSMQACAVVQSITVYSKIPDAAPIDR